MDFAPKGRLWLLHGRGYKSHVSLARIQDHLEVACAFRKHAEISQPPEVIVAGYPTIELSAECVSYARKRNVPVALDIRDAWPDIFLEAVPNVIRPIAKMALRPYDRYAGRVLSGASALVSLTEPFLNWSLNKAQRRRHSFDAVIPMTYQIEYNHLGATTTNTTLIEGDVDPCQHFIVCLFCTFGRQYDIGTIISAARLLEDRGVLDVRFVLCGLGEGLGQWRKLAQGVRSVIFPGWLNKTKINEVMLASSVGLAPYFPERNFIGNIPNKPIEYMSAGLPIVSCLDGLLADIIRREEIGFNYKAGDPGSLVNAISDARADRGRLAHMGARAKGLFAQQFRPEIVMEQYHQFILRLAATRSRTTRKSQS